MDGPISNPPISPDSAVMVPDMLTADAVTCPSGDSTKLEELISKRPFELLMKAVFSSPKKKELQRQESKMN